jgi:hypothetical protein
MAERRVPLWRCILAGCFLVLFCLAAPAALVTGWARLTVVDSEVYARKAGAIADEARVQYAVTQTVANQAQTMLAGENPTASQVIQSRVVAAAVGEATSHVVTSEAFRQTWEAANRDAHRLLVTDPPAGQARPVALDLSPLQQPIEAEMRSLNVDMPPDLKIGPDDLRIEVFDADTADRIRQAAHWLDGAFWVSLAATVAAFVLSIALASDRLAALGRVGFGLAIGMVLLIGLLLVGEAALASAAGGDGPGVVVQAIVDAISQGLRLSAVGLALLGLLSAGLFGGLRSLRGSTVRRAASVE